jgi:hypothetical protein
VLKTGETKKAPWGQGAFFKLAANHTQNPPWYFFNQLLSFPMSCFAAMGCQVQLGHSPGTDTVWWASHVPFFIYNGLRIKIGIVGNPDA